MRSQLPQSLGGTSAVFRSTAGSHGLDAAIVDVHLGLDLGLTGDLLSDQPSAHVVIATGTKKDTLSVEVLRLGAAACVSKPFDVEELLALLEQP